MPQYATTLRNQRLADIIAATGAGAKFLIATGNPPANCSQPDSGVALALLTLPSVYLGTPVNGVVTQQGTWSATATGGASATPGYWRLKDSTGTATVMQGTAGVGTGEINFATTITSGQTVNIIGFQIAAGGA